MERRWDHLQGVSTRRGIGSGANKTCHRAATGVVERRQALTSGLSLLTDLERPFFCSVGRGVRRRRVASDAALAAAGGGGQRQGGSGCAAV